MSIAAPKPANGRPAAGHRRLHLLSIDVPPHQVIRELQLDTASTNSSTTPASEKSSPSPVTSPYNIKAQRRRSLLTYHTSPSSDAPPQTQHQHQALTRSTSLSRHSPSQSLSSQSQANSQPQTHIRRQSTSTATQTLTETYAPLLHYIAQKEAKCLELRSQLATHESELAILKRRWEKVVGRDRYASASASSGVGARSGERPGVPPASVVMGRKSSGSNSSAWSEDGRSSIDDSASSYRSNSTTPTSIASSPKSLASPSPLPLASQPTGTRLASSPSPSPVAGAKRPHPKRRPILLEDYGSAPVALPLRLSTASTTSASSYSSHSSRRSSLQMPMSLPGTALASFLPSLTSLGDRFIDAGAKTTTTLVSDTLDKILSAKQQRRMSGVLEGVLGWSLPLAASASTEHPSHEEEQEDEWEGEGEGEDDTITRRLPTSTKATPPSSPAGQIQSSPSNFKYDLHNLPSTPESSVEGEGDSKEVEDEENWNW